MNFDSYLLFAVSLLLGSVGAYVVYRWGGNLSLIDVPGYRSSHTKRTPKGGGIGILAAFIFCGVFAKLPALFWLPAALLSLVSLLGDRKNISPNIRLTVQFACTAIVLYCIAGSTPFANAWLGSGFSLFLFGFFAVFIVGSANLYNFMDGINGIAAISGIIAFGLLGVYGLQTGKDTHLILISLALTGGCLGFLPWNVPAARVFMGDVGSILLGFLFACTVVAFSRSVTEFLVLMSFLFPFYADEGITLLERVYRGDSLFKAHRSHLYQFLANERGIDHWKVSLGYGLMQAIIGTSFWMLSGYGFVVVMTALLVYSTTFSVVNFKVKMAVSEKEF